MLQNPHKPASSTPAPRDPAPGPAPASPGLAESQAALDRRREHEAEFARRFALPIALTTILGLEQVHLLGARSYLEQFLGEAGQPTDPIERLLLEQLALAHHRAAALHVQAAQAREPEAIKALNGAAVRLVGELRRLALALKVYRLPPGRRSFQVVQQQNIATGGGQQAVSYVDAGSDQATLSARDELEGTDHDRSDRLALDAQEPPARGGRADQRTQAAAVDA
jgi:hypothetical protein